MIAICRLELPFDQGEELVLVQGAVVITICPAELRKADTAPTDLAAAELAGMIAIEMLKKLLGRALRFVEIDGAVGVTIYCREGARRPTATRKRCGYYHAAREAEQEQLPP